MKSSRDERSVKDERLLIVRCGARSRQPQNMNASRSAAGRWRLSAQSSPYVYMYLLISSISLSLYFTEDSLINNQHVRAQPSCFPRCCCACTRSGCCPSSSFPASAGGSGIRPCTSCRRRRSGRSQARARCCTRPGACRCPGSSTGSCTGLDSCLP